MITIVYEMNLRDQRIDLRSQSPPVFDVVVVIELLPRLHDIDFDYFVTVNEE